MSRRSSAPSRPDSDDIPSKRSPVMPRCRKRNALVLSLLLLTSPIGASAADAPPKGYVCLRARTPIVIDGKLDDSAWSEARWTDEFQDIEGDRKPHPRFRTRA